MPDGFVHREVLQVQLLVRDDQVDIIGAAQAVVGRREQAVGVRRQVDARDPGAFVGNDVEEAGVLVAETVVVLAPDGGGHEEVQRGDGGAPGDVQALFQPFRVLVEHRIDDVDKGFIGGEEAVASAEDVALEPPFERMLAEDLHDPPVGGEFAAVRVFGEDLCHPGFFARLVNSA